MKKQGIYQSVFPVAMGRVYHHSFGLINYRNIFILVYKRQRYVLSFKFKLPYSGYLHYYLFPGFKPVTGLLLFAINPNFSIFNQGFNQRAGKFIQLFCDKGIQSLAFHFFVHQQDLSSRHFFPLFFHQAKSILAVILPHRL